MTFINKELIKKEIKDYLDKPRYKIYNFFFIYDFSRGFFIL